MRPRTWAFLGLVLWVSAPWQSASQERSLVLRVLQTDQVFYSTRSGGVESKVNCSISGSVFSPGGGTAVDTSPSSLMNASLNSYSGLSMHCSNQSHSAGWRHVLNTMLVVASDGNAYVLGCEAAFRWSKCRALQTGDVFRASGTNNGLTVFAADSNGKATEIDFQVLTSRALKLEQPAKPQEVQNPAPSSQGKQEAGGTGTVTIFCSQVAAEVYVDGKFVGNPPVILDLAEGSHTFDLKSDGFAPWERKLEVLKNSAVTLNATLDRAR